MSDVVYQYVEYEVQCDNCHLATNIPKDDLQELGYPANGNGAVKFFREKGWTINWHKKTVTCPACGGKK